MAEIVNLRRARKQRSKKEQEHTAAQNRIDFGRRKDEKQLQQRLNNKAEQTLDQHKLSDISNKTD